MLLVALKNFYERKMAARRAYWQVRHELDSCSDRDLYDLGFSRHDIPRIAMQAADQAKAKAVSGATARDGKHGLGGAGARRGGRPTTGALPATHRYY